MNFFLQNSFAKTLLSATKPDSSYIDDRLLSEEDSIDEFEEEASENSTAQSTTSNSTDDSDDSNANSSDKQTSLREGFSENEDCRGKISENYCRLEKNAIDTSSLKSKIYENSEIVFSLCIQMGKDCCSYSTLYFISLSNAQK